MADTDRLAQIIEMLSDGAMHTASAIASKTGVSERTIYRDMERLQAAGVPISGARGVGYKATGDIVLPPITLTNAELGALNLGIAVVAQAGDAELAQAAVALAEKLDAALPQRALSEAEHWKSEFSPIADMARGLGHISTIRSAIKARQKLQIRLADSDEKLVIHPLDLSSFGRVWLLRAWNETREKTEQFRIDLLAEANALPELFAPPD